MHFVPPNLNYLYAAILLRELALHGCKRVVISPGSRSTPLAHTAIALGHFQIYVIPDERSAAFFALGLSKADGVPAVLICTSGTAAANYFPAVIEAAQSLTPLVVITADRPSRMRNTGAAQTIDQQNLYGRYAKLYHECEPAAAGAESPEEFRNSLMETLRNACFERRGPLHFNVCLDEPLAPLAVHTTEVAKIWKRITTPGAPERESLHPDDSQREGVAASRAFSTDALSRAIEKIAEGVGGLIVCGPASARSDAEADAIHSLARHLGWPLLADISSGLRFAGDPVIPFYDLFLRHDEYKLLAPDVVIVFGAHPTSRVLNDYLDRHRAAFTIRVQPHRQRWDPNARTSLFLRADLLKFAQAVSCELTASRDSFLLDPFQKAANAIRSGLSILNSDSWIESELLYVWEAVQALPDGAHLVLANSMPIRYADSLCAAEGKRVNVQVMRGANGIDGTASHAAGISAADDSAPALLVCGDLAFLHDLGGLAAVSCYAPKLSVLLLDNNGGGIFHFLPVHEHDPHFETIHGTPHDLNLAAAKELFQLAWQPVTTPSELPALMLQSHTRPRVFHVRTDREKNLRQHRELVELLLKRILA